MLSSLAAGSGSASVVQLQTRQSEALRMPRGGQTHWTAQGIRPSRSFAFVWSSELTDLVEEMAFPDRAHAARDPSSMHLVKLGNRLSVLAVLARLSGELPRLFHDQIRPSSSPGLSRELTLRPLLASTSLEYFQICRAVAIGFAVMGFLGYFVKLIHIPMYVPTVSSPFRPIKNT